MINDNISVLIWVGCWIQQLWYTFWYYVRIFLSWLVYWTNHMFLLLISCMCASSHLVKTIFFCINQGMTCHSSCIISERCLEAFFLQRVNEWNEKIKEEEKRQKEVEEDERRRIKEKKMHIDKIHQYQLEYRTIYEQLAETAKYVS